MLTGSVNMIGSFDPLLCTRYYAQNEKYRVPTLQINIHSEKKLIDNYSSVISITKVEYSKYSYKKG